MKLCRDKTALTNCGTTLSSYPTIPGKIVSPVLSFAIKLSRSSSFTRRVRSRCSLNSFFRSSPRVVGRFITDGITSRKLYAGAEIGTQHSALSIQPRNSLLFHEGLLKMREKVLDFS